MYEILFCDRNISPVLNARDLDEATLAVTTLARLDITLRDRSSSLGTVEEHPAVYRRGDGIDEHVATITRVDEGCAGPLHPLVVAEFVIAHANAFRALPVPAKLEENDLVWLADHYYPGIVTRAGERSVTVSAPTWDPETGRAMTRSDGTLALDKYHYPRALYRMLRVDAASTEFWPSPAGWASVEISHIVPHPTLGAVAVVEPTSREAGLAIDTPRGKLHV
jgi:hypothetical protein